jgi:hypothetical protein
MSDMRQLGEKIRARVTAAERRRLQAEEQRRRREADREQRVQQFQALADRLGRSFIRPGLNRLAAHFKNAVPVAVEETGRHGHGYVFGPTAAFPAVARLELAVRADEPLENVLLVYRLEVLPAPSPLHCADRLVFPLHQVNEERAAAWVEEKLLQFVGVYFRVAGDEAEDWPDPYIRRSAA